MTQVTAVRGPVQVSQDDLLGYLAFQNIEEIRIHKDDLGQLFDNHGLSRNFLPHEIKPHDAFRRASSTAAQSIQVDINGQKQNARLLVREVKRDSNRIVRNLVREIVDAGNEVTDYVTVGKMVYDRTNHDMVISWDHNYLGEYDYRGLLHDTQALYNEWTQFHTKDTVRNIVSKIMKSTNPVSIQRGGRATFIPKTGQDVLMGLKDMVADLPGNTGSVVETIPLIDSEDTRDLIQKRAEEAFKSEVSEVIDNFAALANDEGEVTKEQVQRYLGKFLTLQQRTKEYQTLIQKNLSGAELLIRKALERVNNTPIKEEDE